MSNDTTDMLIEGEFWRPVVGYEKVYAISNYGRVMRIAEGINTYKGRILKSKKHTGGYYVVGFPMPSRHPKQFKVHKLVANAFLGESNGLEVNHIDGDKSNNHLENLEYVTSSENQKHAFRMGLQKPMKAEDCPAAKLTWEKVKEIRSLHSNGESIASIARRFNIGHHTAWCIIKHRTWKD